MAEAAGGSADGRDRLRGLAMVLAGVIAYVVIHAGFRLLASSTLGEDDTLDQILVQELRLGYEARQPPLYDWLLYAVQQVTGPRLVAFLAIKYAALVATAVMLYLAAYRILADRLWAVLTVESLALIYQIAWRYHEGFTHEVLAMTAVAATLLAFLRIYDHGRWRDYLLYGLIAGVGLNTEPNFAVYQLCLWGAAALQPAIRARIRPWRLLVAIMIAAAMAAPFLIWLTSDPVHWGELWRASARGWLKDRLIGVKDGARGPLMYLLPLIAILPAVFPGFIRTAWNDIRSLVGRQHDAAPDLERFVLSTMLLGIVLSIAGGLVFGIGGYAMHVLMPLYVTSVVWLIGVARRSPRGAERQGLFACLALAIAVIALVARLANMFVYDPVCGKCRWGIPYAGLAEALRQHDVGSGATFLMSDNELAGNLRQHFPGATFVLVGPRSFKPRGIDLGNRDLTIVWEPQSKRAAFADEALAHTAGRPLPFAQAVALDIPWRHLWRPEGYRTSRWQMLRVAK